MKASQTGSIISTIIAIGLATASCGARNSDNKATAKSTASSSINLGCAMMYYDSDIQKNPLYTNSFEAELPVTAEVVNFFGVTPDTNDYYASLTPNQGEPTQVALVLGRASTQVSASTILETKTTDHQMVILQVNSARSFVLSCTKK